MVAPEKICWGASGTKVPRVSGVKEFYRTKPIVLAENTKNKVMDGMKVPTVHRNLGADGGTVKLGGATASFKPPLAASMIADEILVISLRI